MMQSLAFLWFDMEMTQRYLREKTFAPAPLPANSASLNRLTGASRTTGNAIARKPVRLGEGFIAALQHSNFRRNLERNI
jgi:hypothetical protein